MGSGSSPCASCKLLRRRCAKDCVFAPYFPSDDPHKFAIVHKVFGASNVSKMLQELPVEQRSDAVNSLVYEANARVRDPVYGCVGAITYLQNQVTQLQMQLTVAQAEILCIQMHQAEQHQQHLLLDANTHHHQFMLNEEDHHHHNHHHVVVEDHHKSFLLQNNNNNNNNALTQLLNFSAGGNPRVIYHDSFKKESSLAYGHDMVS